MEAEAEHRRAMVKRWEAAVAARRQERALLGQTALEVQAEAQGAASRMLALCSL